MYRAVNLEVERVSEELGGGRNDRLEILCECGEEGGCGQRVRVPIDVYERVRAQDDRFVVRPGHETPELEDAVEWTDDYVVVDKVPAAEPHVEDDPRGAPSA